MNAEPTDFNPFETTIPSDFDVENLKRILVGELGDWFDADLFRLIRKADLHNRERLRMIYPMHVGAYETYLKEWKS